MEPPLLEGKIASGRRKNPNRKGFSWVSGQRSTRQDIQILRGIAVLAVVAYHAGIPLPGGFLGVDVFFVISGFVISTLLLREFTEENHVNLRNFFARRARRLLPALVVVIFVTLLAAWFIYPIYAPVESTLITGVAALFLGANVAIDRLTWDYFSAPAAENALLNMWSLSVEEQFYLLFPVIFVVLLTLGLRKPHVTLQGVAVLTVISFGLAVLGSSDLRIHLPFGQSVLGFYSPVTRAWEFGVGVAVAIVNWKMMRPSWQLVVGGTGWLGIACAFLFITSDYPTPGIAALLPVMSTAAVIVAKLGGGWMHLKRGFSWIGDVSYSWYLWHWPVIALSAVVFPQAPVVKVLAAALSIIPATMSYYWLESPLRNGQKIMRLNARQFLVVGYILVLVIASLTPEVFRRVVEPNTSASALAGDFEEHQYYEKMHDISYPCQAFPDCRQSQALGDPQILIVGNSHGAHLFVGLAESLPTQNVAWISGSAALYQIPGKPAQSPDLLASVINSRTVDTIIVGEYWSQPNRTSMPAGLETFVNEATASGKGVVIPNGSPHISFPAYRCKYGLALAPQDKICAFPSGENDQRFSAWSAYLSEIASSNPLVAIPDTYAAFCSDNTCRIGDEGSLWFRDNNHFGITGSQIAAHHILAHSLAGELLADAR